MKLLRVIIVIVVVLAVLGAAGFALVAKRSGATGQQTVVRIEAAQLGSLAEIVSAPGAIEPKTNVEISAKTSARVVELPYDEGDMVTKGDPDANPPIPASVVVRLDSKDLESRLVSVQADRAARAAQIEVERAHVSSQEASLLGQHAALEQAQRDLERKTDLLASNDISQVAFDEARLKFDDLKARYDSARYSLNAAKLNLKVLEHNLESADASIDQAKESLSYTTITAPIDGTITRINAEVGEMVVTGMMNNPGTKILEIGDLSEMLVLAQVDESDVGKLRVGQSAQVHVQAWPDKVFLGRVRAVALSNEVGAQGSKYYETEVLLVDPNEQIFTGMTADVDIEVAQHDNVLILPSQAVLEREVDELPVAIRDQLSEEEKGKAYAAVVFIYRDGKAIITPVRIGPSNATHTIITSGISPGEKVIIGPYKELERLTNEKPVKDEREAQPQNASEAGSVEAQDT